MPGETSSTGCCHAAAADEDVGKAAAVDMSREVARLLRDQCGVIGRRQVLATGLTRIDVDRMVRRREWVRLLPGVYVDHTGEPTWLQRCWAGVLYYAPAALAATSATRLVAGPGWRHHDDTGPVWVAVASGRNVTARSGYRVRYLARFDEQVLLHVSPPRVRFEEACLDLVMATPSELERIQLLAAACQSRCTTAQRLLAALARRTRVPQRRWLEAVLRDIGQGTWSVLEHGYLTKVERPHGLPRACRQAPSRRAGGQVYRDVSHPDLEQLIELDGFLFHNSPIARDADLERDLDAAVAGQGTVRLGWGQVFGRPCRTAGKVGKLVVARGWTGTVRRCGSHCEAT
jgi:hypothetical protein